LKTFIPAALLATCLSAATAFAATGAQLAEEKQCMQCHATDHGAIGPSFQTIGAIYRRMKNPVPKMSAVIRDGSAAHLGPLWDRARMPDDSERPAISPREARQLSRWILSLRERQ
jgi:cytochrome c